MYVQEGTTRVVTLVALEVGFSFISFHIFALPYQLYRSAPPEGARDTLW